MVVYNGEHSLLFQDWSPADVTVDQTTKQFTGTHTWEDWHLIPASRPTMAMPKYEAKRVGIPGRNGSLDMSDYLTGKPVFGDREGSFQFFVDHDSYNPGENWMSVKRAIMQELHGKRKRMCLTDDPGWYYEGRFVVGEWQSEKDYSKVTINYQVDPYKISIIKQGENDIIWDTFNFDLDYDYYAFHQMAVPNDGLSHVFPINAVGKIVTPSINFHEQASQQGDAVTATFKGAEVTVNAVTDRGTLGTAEDEIANLGLSGSGVITVSFREKSI